MTARQRDRGRRSRPALEVLEPGLLLTVQDLGRRGFEHLGVPRAGAADHSALERANRLIGNAPGAAALEVTLLGPRLRAARDVWIAMAGADLDARLTSGGPDLASGGLDLDRAHRLAPGDILEFAESGDDDRGCRAYVAVAGGLDVPPVLGSRSTSLVGAFGGFEGRALRAGDVLAAFDADEVPPSAAVVSPPPASSGGAVRVLPGPAASEPGGAARLEAFLATRWTVSLSSDRRGLRLEADEPLDVPADAGDRPSHGVGPGTIQLPPSGRPLVLMPDAGVTGGYPVLAIVVTADLARLGQLAPAAPVRFELA